MYINIDTTVQIKLNYVVNCCISENILYVSSLKVSNIISGLYTEPDLDVSLCAEF